MKQLRLPIFNSKIKIYNLRVMPSDLIFDEVLDLKKKFEATFGKQPLSQSKPHITVATFKMNSKHQDFLMETFSQLSGFEKFKLCIDGFHVFEGSKTLYLKIPKTETIDQIHQKVQILHDNHLKRKLKSFSISDKSHMTISKTTGKKMLYESLQYFQRNGYSREWEVDHLTLVSRSKYKTWDWQHEIKLSS